MISLIRGAHVLAPDDRGVCDLLIAGDRLVRIAPCIELRGDEVQEISGAGFFAVPGFVDSLVHITGGGGEGGFRTRTPEISSEECVRAGVTSLVGGLGTDAVTRTLSNLLAKAAALCEDGLHCYCHTGSYQVPVRTLTGSVMDDLVLIDRFIGVGEVAIADHRSSQPSVAELARLTADARVGGMLAGKGGIVSVHVGDSPAGLQMLHAVLAQSDLPITQFYPTHINRNRVLLEQGFAFARAGGVIDFTTSTTAQLLAEGEVSAAQALREALDAGVPISQISFSSDANASLPQFDANGGFLGLGIGRIDSLFGQVREAVLLHGVALTDALRTVTENPARILHLRGKGRLQDGGDADLVLVAQDDLSISDVWSGGKRLLVRGEPKLASVFVDG